MQVSLLTAAALKVPKIAPDAAQHAPNKSHVGTKNTKTRKAKVLIATYLLSY